MFSKSCWPGLVPSNLRLNYNWGKRGEATQHKRTYTDPDVSWVSTHPLQIFDDIFFFFFFGEWGPLYLISPSAGKISLRSHKLIITRCCRICGDPVHIFVFTFPVKELTQVVTLPQKLGGHRCWFFISNFHCSLLTFELVFSLFILRLNFLF